MKRLRGPEEPEPGKGDAVNDDTQGWILSPPEVWGEGAVPRRLSAPLTGGVWLETLL